jgi:hypothetical protein
MALTAGGETQPEGKKTMITRDKSKVISALKCKAMKVYG